MTPTADAPGDGGGSPPGHATWRPLAVVMVMAFRSRRSRGSSIDPTTVFGGPRHVVASGGPGE